MPIKKLLLFGICILLLIPIVCAGTAQTIDVLPSENKVKYEISNMNLNATLEVANDIFATKSFVSNLTTTGKNKFGGINKDPKDNDYYIYTFSSSHEIKYDGKYYYTITPGINKVKINLDDICNKIYTEVITPTEMTDDEGNTAIYNISSQVLSFDPRCVYSLPTRNSLKVTFYAQKDTKTNTVTIDPFLDANCDSGDLSTTCILTHMYVATDGENINGTGTLLIDSGGAIVDSTNLEDFIINFSQVIMNSSTANITGGNVTIYANNLTISNNARMLSNGLGYTQAAGPGAGTTYGSGHGTGGGYGGVGGGSNSGPSAGGIAHHSSLETWNFGGGGGNGQGGTGGYGGGIIKLIVYDILTLNGTAYVHGNTGGTNSGGGAGGAIYVSTSTITGNGTFYANGGAAGGSDPNAGNGGGGRIAIYYDYSTFTTFNKTSAAAGTSYGSSYNPANPGTIIIVNKQANSAIIKDGFRFQDYGTVSNETGVTSTTFWDSTKAGVTNLYNFSNLTIWQGAEIYTLASNLTVQSNLLNFTGGGIVWSYISPYPSNLIINATTTSFGENFTNEYIYNYGNMTLDLGVPIRNIINGNIITYSTNSKIILPKKLNETFSLINATYGVYAIDTYSDIGIQDNVQHLNLLSNSILYGSTINLTLSNLTIDSGSSVITYGSNGLSGALGTGTGGAVQKAAGGGYGGTGSGSSDYQSGGGIVHGSSLSPSRIGGPGGRGQNGYGGWSGGLINLVISDTLELNGTIRCNGITGSTNDGSGSGGGIKVVTYNLKGNGSFSANGGNAIGANYGAGGGGRIAVYYNQTSFVGFNKSTVSKGTGSTYNTANYGTMIFVDVDDKAALINYGFRFQGLTSVSNESSTPDQTFWQSANPNYYNFTNLTITNTTVTHNITGLLRIQFSNFVNISGSTFNTLPSIFIKNESVGMLEYNQSINSSNFYVLPGQIKITTNNISVDSGNNPTLNISGALLTIYNTDAYGFLNRTAFKNGAICHPPECTELSDADTYVFNVSRFSNYSVGEGLVGFVQNIIWITTGGYTDDGLILGMTIDRINATCEFFSQCNISVMDPDGVKVVDNNNMSNTTNTSFFYDPNIYLNKLGTWTVNVTGYGVIAPVTASDTFYVGLPPSTISNVLYGYSPETIPSNQTITDLAIYEFNTIEIQDYATNLSSNWSTVLAAIRKNYELNIKTGLVYVLDYNLSSDMENRDRFIANITDHFDELLGSQYIDDVLYIMVKPLTTEGYTEENLTTNNINLIGEAIYDITGNEFAIYSSYNSTSLETDYIINDPEIRYITAADQAGLVNNLANLSRTQSSKIRLYYNLTNDQKTIALNYQNRIMIPLYSTFNTSSSVPNASISELVGGGFIVYNNLSSPINATYNVSNATLVTGKDVWDLNNGVQLTNNTDGNITFLDIPAYSFSLIGLLDIDHISMTSATTADLYKGTTSRILNSNYTDGTRDSASDAATERAVELWDYSYTNGGVSIYYGWLNSSYIINPFSFNGLDYLIIADKNDAEVDKLFNGSATINKGVFGYMAVNDYKAAAGECNTTWVAGKKGEVDAWIVLNESMNIFIDGFDLGNIYDTGCFFQDVKNITDYIKQQKIVELGVNVFTDYQEFAALSSDNGFAMIESCAHTWKYKNGVDGTEGYNYSNQYWEDYLGYGDFNKSIWYSSHNIDVICVAFVDRNDTTYLPNSFENSGYDSVHNGSYAQLEKLWLKSKILGYDYFYAATPLFGLYHFDKFYDVGTKLQTQGTKEADLYSMRYTNGIAYYNSTSDIAWFDDGRTINNASIELTLFDDIVHTYNICINNNCGYTASTPGDGWSYDKYSIYFPVSISTNSKGHYIINITNADGGFVGDDSETIDYGLHSYSRAAGVWSKFPNGNHMASLVLNDSYKMVYDDTDKITQVDSLTSQVTTVNISSSYSFASNIYTYPKSVLGTGTFKDIKVYNNSGYIVANSLNSTTCTTDTPLFATTSIDGVGTVGVCRDTTTETFVVDFPSLSLRQFKLNMDDIKPSITIIYPTAGEYYSTNYLGYFNMSIDELGGNCSTNDTRWTFKDGNTTSFSYANNTYLADGVYWTNISCWDSSNNNASTTLNFTLDTTAPNIILVTPTNYSYLDYNTGVNLTTQFNDSIGVENMTLYLYNGSSNALISTTPTTLGGILNGIFGTLNDLWDGIFIWFYDIFDFAGNKNMSTNYTVTLDTEGPSIQFLNPTPPDDDYINYTNFVINITIYDINYNYSYINLWNETSNVNYTNLTSMNWSMTNAVFNDSLVNFKAYVVDKAGHTNYTETRNITIDTVKPVLSISYPIHNSTYNNSQLDFNWTAIDTNINVCTYLLDGVMNVSSINLTLNGLTDGWHNLSLNCSDLAGNLENTSTIDFEINSPQVTLYLPANNSNQYSPVNFTCYGFSGLGSNITNVSLYVGTSTSTTWSRNITSNGSGNKNYSFLKTLADGTYKWNCEVCDNVSCTWAESNFSLTVIPIPITATIGGGGGGGGGAIAETEANEENKKASSLCGETENFFDRLGSKCKLENGICDDGENPIIDKDCNIKFDEILNGKIIYNMWFVRLSFIISIFMLLIGSPYFPISVIIFISLLVANKIFGG